ncbi:uncharacterized protein L199_007536 [Kwoniella botswanensis]|uniref:uncharacterized protein n=1 Tax=Kwoniella botswanensis TaxID=1268659 RepID=UPI00315D6D8D
MPAFRKNQQSSSDNGSSSSSPSPSKGWTKEQKRQLFYHVLRNGERDWGNAVDGETGHQCNDQWKKTLLPQITKACGF